MKVANQALCLLLAVMTGCTDSDGQQPKNANTANTQLSNEPPTAGHCAGWRRSLAKGSQHYEVESCLYEKALQDRASAVKEAIEMSDWDIASSPWSELKPLIATLTQFPEQGSLEAKLRQMDLLPNPPGEYADLERAITASDYLRYMGNVYWFDVETGVYPNNHDYLLSNIAANSDLSDVEFTEVAPGLDADNSVPYQLMATVAGETYHRQAKNYGDWYDLDAVLALLNQIARDRDSQQRFVTLPTGDQTAIVWVVDANALEVLQSQGLLKVSSAELSRVTGKEFEQQVIDTLGVSEH